MCIAARARTALKTSTTWRQNLALLDDARETTLSIAEYYAGKRRPAHWSSDPIVYHLRDILDGSREKYKANDAIKALEKAQKEERDAAAADAALLGAPLAPNFKSKIRMQSFIAKNLYKTLHGRDDVIRTIKHRLPLYAESLRDVLPAVDWATLKKTASEMHSHFASCILKTYLCSWCTAHRLKTNSRTLPAKRCIFGCSGDNDLDDLMHYFVCDKLWSAIKKVFPLEYGLELLYPTATASKINNPNVTSVGAGLAFRLGLFATTPADFLPITVAFRLYHDSRTKFRPGNHSQVDIDDAAAATLKHLRDLDKPNSRSPNDDSENHGDEDVDIHDRSGVAQVLRDLPELASSQPRVVPAESGGLSSSSSGRH